MLRKYSVYLFGCLIITNIVSLLYLTQKQNRLLDCGRLQGLYEASQQHTQADIERLDNRLQTLNAWMTSIKSDLAGLEAITQDGRQKQIITNALNDIRMVERNDNE